MSSTTSVIEVQDRLRRHSRIARFLLVAVGVLVQTVALVSCVVR